ncbi:MAG: diphosphate--fructose-6-phosphate 1-phosphotransferase [Dehalococcoidia bacterium]
MQVQRKRLGILVGGGPAPGLNSAISAVTIEAVNSGLDVIGIYDGFEHLMAGRTDMIRPLGISDVSRIHFTGGSVLRISRSNPTKDPADLQRCADALERLGIEYLVSIGGDDTAFGAAQLAKATAGRIRVAHVPKTIDNDLPLPAGMPCLGFETARFAGTRQVMDLMEDSRTTRRWILVTVMGRTAGHLALGMGLAAGATLTIIPEEFTDGPISLRRVASIIEGSILKRRVMGRDHGLVVIAEGITERLEPEELAQISDADLERDPYGHIRLSEVPLGSILRREVERRFAGRGDRMSLVDVTIGYVLRSTPPVPFELNYARTLGYGAVRFLLSAPDQASTPTGGMVCLEAGRLAVLPFEDLRDPETGKTRIRPVDLDSLQYEVARKYMIRLEPRDLEDNAMLLGLAEAAKTTPEQLRAAFASALPAPV